MRLALTSLALSSSMTAEPRRSFGTELASASPKPPRFVDVDKFDVADAAARAHLDERGFVVFRGVLDAAEVDRANELFFDYLEALGSGVDRGESNTWGDDHWPPCAGDAGILPWFGIGQSPFMWFVQTRSRVAAAYRQAWGLDDAALACSFDGCCAWRPGQKTRSGWLHVDQDALRGDKREMLQGLVNLSAPVSAATGGLVLVDRSHRTVFPRLAEQYGEALRANAGDDYFELSSVDDVYTEGSVICCRLDAGDMIIWDSRVAHASHPPSDPAADSHALVRLCAYVCMAPPSPDEAVRRARRAAFDDGQTTTHWPTKVVTTDVYESFAALPENARLCYGDAPRAALTPEVETLL